MPGKTHLRNTGAMLSPDLLPFRERLQDYTSFPPSVVAASVLLSRKMGLRRQALELPVVGCRRAVVQRHSTATVNLGGRLFLGCAAQRDENGDGNRPAEHHSATVVDLWRDSTFATDGWTMLGPGTEVCVRTGASLS